jgi:hypothetical protein
VGLDDETSEAVVVQIGEQEWATVVLPSPTYLLDGIPLEVAVAAADDGEIGISLVVKDSHGDALVEIELYRGHAASLARKVL